MDSPQHCTKTGYLRGGQLDTTRLATLQPRKDTVTTTTDIEHRITTGHQDGRAGWYAVLIQSREDIQVTTSHRQRHINDVLQDKGSYARLDPPITVHQTRREIPCVHYLAETESSCDYCEIRS